MFIFQKNRKDWNWSPQHPVLFTLFHKNLWKYFFLLFKFLQIMDDSLSRSSFFKSVGIFRYDKGWKMSGHASFSGKFWWAFFFSELHKELLDSPEFSFDMTLRCSSKYSPWRLDNHVILALVMFIFAGGVNFSQSYHAGTSEVHLRSAPIIPLIKQHWSFSCGMTSNPFFFVK